MAQPNIFTIRNLRCSYDGKKEVVLIPELDIPRGIFVGLLSVSGGGKSTTLETLGLMNQTFLPGSDILFYPEDDSEGYAYATLWEDKNEPLASAIRGEHFSFIFQQTNLMPNFTAYENICIAQMIQGKSKSDSIAHAKKVMETIGLKRVDESKKTFELSGGEQQRVAFARAITPEFTVIFGDEPTGNLDPENAHALMGKLYEAVKDKNRTAIIVSHDLDLIQTYADMLVVIQKPGAVGELKVENVFRSELGGDDSRQWRDHSGALIADIVPTIRKTMKWGIS